MIAKMKALGFRCSFCGRSKGEVENIMAGTPQWSADVSNQMLRKSAFICNECVRHYSQMVSAKEIGTPMVIPK